jgi:YgiT-type zinc finger domain-containing protein
LGFQRSSSKEGTVYRVICRTGETAPGRTTVTLERGASIVVIKEVPAEVCNHCGEYYLDSAIAARVETLAGDAIENHAEVGILRFAA